MNFLTNLDLIPPRASLRQLKSFAIDLNIIVYSFPYYYS
jgi:hypothetical protein